MSEIITYKMATRAETIDARKLIYSRFVESGYIKETGGMIYTDHYLNDSVYFVAKRNDEVIGTIRIVKNSKRRLPVVNEFCKDERKWDGLNVVEVGNLAAIPGNNVARQLYKEVLRYSHKNGINLWIAAVDQDFFEFLRKRYFLLTPFYSQIAKAKEYVGSVSVPIVIKINRLMDCFL